MVEQDNSNQSDLYKILADLTTRYCEHRRKSDESHMEKFRAAVAKGDGNPVRFARYDKYETGNNSNEAQDEEDGKTVGYRRKAMHIEAYRCEGGSNPPNLPWWLSNLPVYVDLGGAMELRGGFGLKARPGDWFVLERNKIKVYGAGDFEEMFEKDAPCETKQDSSCDGVPVLSESTAIGELRVTGERTVNSSTF